MESFWGSMQIELLNRQSGRTFAELTSAITEWIEVFDTPIRRNSSLDHLRPNEYEALHPKETSAALS
jgi:putative transposase